MSGSTTNAYLRDAVMTASPEQLQLMLYDGAIRFATQGKEAVAAKKFEDAFNKLSRAQAIVLEMERGLKHDVSPELCERMSALYMFVYRKLVDGCVKHEVKPIEDAIGILAFERETWVMLLNKLTAEVAGRGSSETAAPATHGCLSIEG